jgi:hypothetical protein
MDLAALAAVIPAGPKDKTSGAQLRLGESRDSGFDASHRPGMTVCVAARDFGVWTARAADG